MVNELVKQRERKDEEKLMNAIHKNYRDTRMERRMNEQLEEIEYKEEQEWGKKMCKILFVSAVAGLIIEIVALKIAGVI